MDVDALPRIEPADLAAILKGERETAEEAVKYLVVMALVDGTLDEGKLKRVLDYSRTLDIEANYLTELVEAASGHMAWVVADMTRKNFDSVLSRSSEGLYPAAWLHRTLLVGGIEIKLGPRADRATACAKSTIADARQPGRLAGVTARLRQPRSSPQGAR